jgi:hypothetical protein
MNWRTLAVAAFFLVSAADADACSIDPFRLTSTARVSINMHVVQPQPCNINFTAPAANVTGVVIQQPPSNGVTSVNKLGYITYRAKSGYTGADFFTYNMHVINKRKEPGLIPVRVSVTVYGGGLTTDNRR